VTATQSSTRFIVGLTGGIGSGKTTVADQFGALGATLVDADLIAHQLTAPHGAAMPAITAAFGADIATADGAMDRARMRELVFKDPSQRARLESILHPLIRAENERQVRDATGPYVVMVVPLLVESGRPKDRVDRVLVVDCPEAIQIERVISRSKLAREQVLAIMKAQASREQRLTAGDDVIDNGGDAAALASQIEKLHKHYLALARAKNRAGH
jgi:dephospho-CoA kinase